ncbi:MULTISPECIES: TIR domain-containing protein [Actinosynnema]|uniref:TIR domain-containing protein n=1 Tax=Actinosynnema TaxID=40566 RepID=UPI0020A500AE|nr:TIR domain-containing protein [Actinosynnema pretiosum]MCP2098048.1 TIR domain-containing protein [Actinosynnema pretiosum]
MSGYEYDVFISYAHLGSVRNWLLNHFREKLFDCLADQMVETPRVYVDDSMDRGTHWPSNLRKALLHSKIIVPLLTPPYFQSSWCLAEFHSMWERQKSLGLGSLEKPQGLIYPILYADSDNFPKYASEFSWWDFKKYAYPDLSYQGSLDYSKFHGEVIKLAGDLAALLRQVPDWQPGWPIADPDPVRTPPTPIPRF